jgi:hypothetical protein
MPIRISIVPMNGMKLYAIDSLIKKTLKNGTQPFLVTTPQKPCPTKHPNTPKRSQKKSFSSKVCFGEKGLINTVLIVLMVF